MAAPADYRWSSHRSYACGIAPAWLTTAFVLALFAEDPHTARERMTAFTNAASPDAQSLDPHPPAAHVLIGPSTTAAGLDELVMLACRHFEVDAALLTGPSRRRDVNKVRAWIAWTAQRQKVSTLADVARCFHRPPSTLSRSIARYKPRSRVHQRNKSMTVPGTNKSTPHPTAR